MTEEGYEEVGPIREVPLEDVLALPAVDEFQNFTQYNTSSPRKTIQIIRDAAKNGERVDIIGWDSDRDMLIPFMTNPGHSPGITAKHFLDELKKFVRAHPGKGSMHDQLSAYLINSSDVIDRGHIDFFQVNVYHR